MYSTIRFGTASKATQQGRRLYRAGVGFELAIKRSPARRLDHSATTSLSKVYLVIADIRSSLLSSLQDTEDNAAHKNKINEQLDISSEPPFYNWHFCQILVHSMYEPL
jgi:hypothetical protein